MGRFKFDISARMERARYTDRELLESLRTYARRVQGRPFTVRQFHAWRGPRPGPNSIIKRFGSWRAALTRIGIKGVRPRQYPAAELVTALEKAWRKVGHPPGARELQRHCHFCVDGFTRRWGSVRNACEMLAAFHEGKISRAKLLRGCGGPARTTIPLDMRWRVMKRDRYRCVKCGTSPAVKPGVELHLDHIRPVSKGGKNEEGNLRTLCRECNLGRGVAAA